MILHTLAVTLWVLSAGPNKRVLCDFLFTCHLLQYRVNMRVIAFHCQFFVHTWFSSGWPRVLCT
eukprot:jgi/Botrbrau1/1833/Bobra.146_1s0028.1